MLVKQEYAKFYVRNGLYTCTSKCVSVIPEPKNFESEEFSIGFRKEDAAFAAKVQEILDSLYKDGTAAGISEKWFGSDVKATGLIKSYGDTKVIRGMNMKVEQGEVVTVIGSSGSGKSTMLRLLINLEHVDDGTIEIGNIHGRRCCCSGRQSRKDIFGRNQ